MKINICILCLAGLFVSLFSAPLFAQDAYLDSLKQELKRVLPDTSRINILLDLGDKGAYYDSREAKKYLMQAYKLAESRKLYYSMGAAMAYTGSIYYYKDDYDSALYYYNRSILLFRKDTSRDARLSVSTVRSEIADVSVARGDTEPAIRIYLEVIDRLQQDDPDNYNAIGNLYLAVGSVYRKMRQFRKALSYTGKGVEQLRKDRKNPVAMAFAQLYVAGNLISLTRFNDARLELDQLQKLADRLQSASLFSQLYGTWGAYYDKSGNAEEAVNSYQKAIKYAQVTGDKFARVSALLQIGLIGMDKGDYQQSVDYLEKALAIIRTTGDKHRELSTLRHLARAHSAMQHNRQAVNYYQAYIKLNDSLNEQETKRKINDIENKYQAEKKQARISALQKNNQLQQLKLGQQKLLNIALVAGFGLLLLIAALLYINLKNKNRLFKQKEAFHRQRIIELEKERQLATAESLLRGQEEERGRLARDLHDGVGGLLSGVKLSLSTMKGNVFLSEENALAFNNVVWQLDQSIAELRRVSHNMMPEALIKFGLKEALENYCENLNQSGKIKVKLQTYGPDLRPEQSTEIVLYRIIQEMLNNVVRHAEARNVLIQLIQEGGRFNLTVEDDGKGFDVGDALKKDGGAGLANIRTRVEYLNGTIDIRSAPGEGTSIHVEGECG